MADLNHWREKCKLHGPDYIRDQIRDSLNLEHRRDMHTVLWELQQQQDAERAAQTKQAIDAAERSAKYAKWAAIFTLLSAFISPFISQYLSK